ncbi:hypothetical protein HAX54_041200 [Datura stramonium]|uniref:Uncharacterized protein n=1 Tax=Datura stramonium TaxID=4076 RepID=A0ABS8SKS4_DATST|nr:hypothetical protein [Datura stramonium]
MDAIVWVCLYAYKDIQILWGYTWARHYNSKQINGGPCLGKGTVATKKQMFTLSALEECECVAKRGGVGVQSTISRLIDAQQHATKETSKEIVGEPRAVLDLECENSQLKVENTAKEIARGPELIFFKVLSHILNIIRCTPDGTRYEEPGEGLYMLLFPILGVNLYNYKSSFTATTTIAVEPQCSRSTAAVLSFDK